MFGRLILAVVAVLSLGATAPAPTPGTGASTNIADACGPDRGIEDWSRPAPPAHIHGNSWYVGTCGITAVLVRTSAGLVLIDTGPEDAAPHVLANIKALGFDPRQVKWLLMTHEHFDHVGGMAAIEAATGAKLVVNPAAAQAMRSGKADPADPQAGVLAKYPMKPARVDRVLGDGAVLTVGGTRFTLHANPTHSPGSTSWTWQSCEGGKCLTIAYADSISTISSPDYRFSDHPARIDAARAGLRVIEGLPCDLIITPHPSSSSLIHRLSGKAPLVDPHGCITHAAQGSAGLAQRLAEEASGK